MSRNVVNDYIKISKKNIKSYIKLVMGNKYNNMIFEKLINKYINTRYYDMYERIRENEEKNINYYLKETSLKLIEENPKNEETVKLMFGLFHYILYFDDVKSTESLESLVDKLKQYINNNIKYDFSKEQLINIIKTDKQLKEEYISLYKTPYFHINKTKTNIKNLYNVTSTYEIKFPKLYSEYAIEKVSNSKIIKEDRQMIEYYLVSIDLLNKIIDSNFNINYLVNFDIKIKEKKTKWARMLNIIDCEIVKEHLNFKISYQDFIENQNIIKELIHQGYHFALIIDDSYTKDLTQDNTLVIFTYIIVHENKKLYRGIKNIVIM